MILEVAEICTLIGSGKVLHRKEQKSEALAAVFERAQIVATLDVFNLINPNVFMSITDFCSSTGRGI